MAEIRVEKKSRPVWPWILGLLLIAAVAWIVMDDDDAERTDTISTVDENRYNEDENNMYSDTTDNNGEAMAYVTYIEKNGQKITEDHLYSSTALTHLSKALKNVATENNVSDDTQQKIDAIQQQADKLKQEKDSKKHANYLSEAFASAAEVMENIQEESFPDLNEEVKEVKEAAQNVKADEIVTNQKQGVKNFFEKSAEAIEAMANNQQVAQNQ